MDKRPIGVFDSGLGGLTVLKGIKNSMPYEKLIYFGDTKRNPYGPRNREDIVKYTEQAVEFLINKDVKAIVIACNTATAGALEYVKMKYDIPIIGVIEDGVKATLRETKNKKVAVIGTEGTISSGKYMDKLKQLDKDIEVFQRACASFVTIVENGEMGTIKSNQVVNYYLNSYKDIDIDTLVLGCTHYQYLEDEIRSVLGERVNIVNPSVEVVSTLSSTLRELGLLNTDDKSIGGCEYYISKQTDKFNQIANNFMEESIDEIRVVEV